LAAFDEVLRVTRGESLLVDAEGFQHALHRGVLVLGIEDLKEFAAVRRRGNARAASGLHRP